ncbi:MAG: sensor histidine kinase [Planctomycetota bacterium]
MVAPASILVLAATDPAHAGVVAGLTQYSAALDTTIETVACATTCVDRLRAGSCLAWALVDADLNRPDVQALIAAQRLPQPLLLVVPSAPTASDYECALRIGAVGVVDANGSLDQAGKQLLGRELLGRLRARQEAWLQSQQLVERLSVQSEELERRCTLQAERFQQSQESYYLDLSRLMTIITNIMDGILFVDRGGHVTMINPVAEDLLHVKSFVAIGKPVREMQGQADLLETLGRDYETVLGGQKEVSSTIEVHHGEHDLLYIKAMTSQVLDYRGQPAGTLSVLRDVTAEFKTDQLKNQYLSIVAHELRTPLTGIKTFATMMAKGSLGDLNDNQATVCDSIREQSVRLEHQIDKLINLGNLESADYGQDREEVSLDDFTAGMLLPFEQPARDRQIDLTFAIEVDDDVALHADRSDLRRACQALIENAVKFARDEGTVEVAVTREEGGLRFHVRDDGIGIDPRYQRRIFEKFFQVEDPLTRHHGGAGLGLFVARGIVEAHGSRIEVSSQLGQGADFSFMLPIHEPEHHRAVAEIGHRID